MAGLTQRKRNAASEGLVDEYGEGATGMSVLRTVQTESSSASRGSLSSPPTSPQSGMEFPVDEDGFSEADMDGRQVKLTLLEEVLLLGLKDEQGYLSFWNENISYVLRGCILMELSMRKRIGCFKEMGGRHHRRPYCDRLIEVVDDASTGEVLLDEALKVMKLEQSLTAAQKQPAGLAVAQSFTKALVGSLASSSGNMKTMASAQSANTSGPVGSDGVAGSRQNITNWIDLLSGETWNLLKVSYQLKQVRERLAKGLVDKGVLRTEKRNFLVFEMATHPVTDTSVKMEIVMRVVNCLLGRGPAPTRRTIALCCAAYAANVIENALTAATVLGGLSLSYSQKDACFARCEEMLVEWSGMSVFEASLGRSPVVASHHADVLTASMGPGAARAGEISGGRTSGGGKVSQQEKERIGWTDVLSGVVGVFLKMDSML